LNDDNLYRTSKEIDALYPNWLDGTTTESGKHSTQVEGTRKTYNKVGTWIEENLGKDVEILDASSGMGYGTADLRERGFNIEDVEPYQSAERKANNPATYSSYADIEKKYDYIISNAVLNVIPDDWRANVLHDMADRLKDGGQMFINTRKAGEEKSIKDKIELDFPQEVLVKRNGRIASYQRFFTPQELREWVQQEVVSYLNSSSNHNLYLILG
jgi:2-polyprenyl-3-methyl-5-hydroxy-6-metoxy-1,4-benzoquinol methylase